MSLPEFDDISPNSRFKVWCVPSALGLLPSYKDERTSILFEQFFVFLLGKSICHASDIVTDDSFFKTRINFF